jgi:predicted nuclease of predicted toxin-antitoxin system
MRFLVDAQLPRNLCTWLNGLGHDARHTLDLPLQNKTPDQQIVEIAERENRIVITKDHDFVQSFMVLGKPKLLLVSTGNISNQNLEKIFRSNLKIISEAFENHGFLELTPQMLVVHS